MYLKAFRIARSGFVIAHGLMARQLTFHPAEAPPPGKTPLRLFKMAFQVITSKRVTTTNTAMGQLRSRAMRIEVPFILTGSSQT